MARWKRPFLYVTFLAMLAWIPQIAFSDKKPKDKGTIEPVTASTEIITGSKLSLEQMEQFLLNAQVKRTKGTSKGIAGTVRATLSDGKITHDAHITTIDEEKSRFEGTRGVELNFRDTYRFDIGAWRLGRMLGLASMIPMSVDRHYQGKSAAFTWWVDNVLMDEETRIKKKMTPPDNDAWGREMYIVRVFDQLIYNVDRNLGNLLIDKNWHLWMIDHSRSFRLHHSLENVKNLVKCDRVLLDNLKALKEEDVMRELKGFVRPGEVQGVMARRDLIVQFFEKQGAASVYDWLKKPM